MSTHEKQQGTLYQGKEICILNKPKLCIHSRHCVTNAIKVFRPNVDGPWIEPDAASKESVVSVVARCPSGALQCRTKDGEAVEQLPDVNTIRISENGPYFVNATARIDGEDMTRAALCRCGHSKNKPFCDKSHVDAEFIATGEPESQDSDPLQNRGGPVTINGVHNGPLVVHGNMEIIAGSGRTINRVESTQLCRCGHSNTKPYCDGSHARSGFVG